MPKNVKKAQEAFKIGIRAVDQLDWKEAEKQFLQAISLDPHYADALTQLGNIAFQQGKLSLAEQRFQASLGVAETALKGQKEKQRWWHNTATRPYLRALRGLGLTQYRRKKRREALGTFQELLRLNPDDHLGVGYFLEALVAGMTWKEMDRSG